MNGEAMPGTRVQVVLITGLVSVSRAAVPAAGSWLMHSALSRRRLAAMPAGQCGEVSQLFADAEVARLVDGGLGAGRSSFLEVLPVLGLLQDR